MLKKIAALFLIIASALGMEQKNPACLKQLCTKVVVSHLDLFPTEADGTPNLGEISEEINIEIFKKVIDLHFPAVNNKKKSAELELPTPLLSAHAKFIESAFKKFNQIDPSDKLRAGKICAHYLLKKHEFNFQSQHDELAKMQIDNLIGESLRLESTLRFKTATALINNVKISASHKLRFLLILLRVEDDTKRIGAMIDEIKKLLTKIQCTDEDDAFYVLALASPHGVLDPNFDKHNKMSSIYDLIINLDADKHIRNTLTAAKRVGSTLALAKKFGAHLRSPQ